MWMANYFNQTKEEVAFAKSRDIYCLVIYDMVSNKRRLKLMHLLEAYGVRVQRSCFEIRTTKSVYQKLLADLTAFYQQEEGDQIRIYKVHQDDRILLDSGMSAEKEEDQIFL